MIKKYKILLSGDKKIKKDKNTALIFSKEEMKNLYGKNPNIKVIGGTRLKKVTNKNEHKADFIIAMPASDEILYIGKRKQRGFIKGYFQVAENEFVEYHSFFILFILFWGMLTAFFILFAVGNQESENTKYERPVIQEAEEWNGVISQSGNIQDLEDERIEIPGYHELYVSTEEPFVILGNPKENTVFFKYEVFDKDILLFESDYIEPGNKMNWDAYDVLPAGDHSLIFVISTLDVKEYYPCNGASLSIQIHVK